MRTNFPRTYPSINPKINALASFVAEVSMSFMRTQLSRVTRKALLWAIPERARLPFRYRLAHFDASNEPELQNLDRIVRDREVALDVGAHDGFYAYRLSQMFKSVHAFELNTDLTCQLQAYNDGKITIHPEGLSSISGDATLYIPVRNGRSLVGWASLQPGNCPGVSEHVEKPVRIRTLDSFGIQNVSFVKIDVEGHELEVLNGGRETLSRDRPVVLSEVRAHNRERVDAWFTDLNYRVTNLMELIGVPGTEENRIYGPA
jgi:FkbM family methyltransferase